jgi:hypothetical protein
MGEAAEPVDDDLVPLGEIEGLRIVERGEQVDRASCVPAQTGRRLGDTWNKS